MNSVEPDARSQNEDAQRWSELTSARFRPFILTLAIWVKSLHPYLHSCTPKFSLNPQEIMTTHYPGFRSPLLRGLFVFCFFGSLAAVHGQSAPTPPASASGAGEIVHLKEFTVAADKDVGYSTTNAIGVTRTNTALIDTPQAVNVINQEFLRDAAPGELYDVLKYVSGISIESNVGDSVMIRGYTVRSQFTDGLSDNQNQSQAGSEPFLFERLEILKGPSALVYGSHATGGVLNRVRKTPLWKAAGMGAVTLGNHAQRKVEFDYTAPLNDQFAYRLLAVYRDEDLNNGVETRHSWFKRWNLDPMVTWRLSKTTQVKVVGEFLREEGFKHWGDNAQLQPFVANGPTTFGRLPRDFTFTDPSAGSENNKWALWAAIETEITPDWSVRLATYINSWDHKVTDVLPSGMQANNVLMGRTARYIYNNDGDVTAALDSVYNFRLGPTDHKFLAIGQYSSSDNDTGTLTGANPPALDIYNPIYTFAGLVSPRPTTNTKSVGKSSSVSFQDHAKFLGDKLQLVGGARRDEYRSYTDNNLTGLKGTRNKGDNWTYKFGVIVKPVKVFSLFYNYAETFNANFGANPDGSTFVPSTGVVKEAGIKTALREGRITATISMFDLQLRQIIGLHPDPALASAGFRVQQARQVTKGIEGDVVLNLVAGWDLTLSGASMDISLPTGLLPRNAPEKTAAAWTRYKFSSGALKGWVVGGGWNWQGRSPSEVSNLIFFPAFSTIDAFTQYAWKRYRFSLNVSNLGDEWYLKRGVNRNIFFAGSERLIKIRVAYSF
ncbi:MAG: TonB-dependent receptor [Opitutus sp.]|nr:TonB-dependent receptor [Opitutus sp.]